MPWVTLSPSKIRVAVQFIHLLKDKNYITNEPVKKEDIIILFQQYLLTIQLKLRFYELLSFMLQIKFIKRNRNNKSYIYFRPERYRELTLSDSDGTLFNQKSKKQNNIYGTRVNSTVVSKPPAISEKINSPSMQNKNVIPICNESVKNLNSKKTHKPKKRTLVSQNVAIPGKKPETKYVSNEKCDYCKCKFSNNLEYNNHIKDIAHVLRQRYRTNKKLLFNETMDIIEFETERNGLKITEIESNINIKNLIECKITSKNNKEIYEITDIILLYTELKEITLNYKLPILLNTQKSETFSINFCFKYEGTYILPVILKIVNRTNKNDTVKYVLKEMVFYIQSDLVKDLKPKLPYERTNKPVSYLENLPIIDGIRPPKGTSVGLECVTQLAFYDLPPLMIKLINWGLKMDSRMSPFEQEKLVELRKLLAVPDKSNCLTAENYCKMLKTLLQFEEHQMKKNIRDYDCSDQHMKRVPVRRGDTKLLSLEVPGLAENRPSLIRGDSLLVRVAGDKCYYKGYIHHVNNTTVHLGFHEKFVIDTHFDEQLYTVTFDFNRRTLRTEHQAVELLRRHNVAKYFFPKHPPPEQPLSNNQFDWFQKNILNNAEQQQAVRHIVSGSSYPYPYLLFGPPGTGKTMTMVEAVLQLWSQQPKCKILVAAPSNSAANEVTSRLLKYIKSKTDIFRMISVSFSYDKIPSDIKQYCNYKDGDYYFPDIETLESFRIVIVTLTAAAKFVWGGVTPGHFTHVFIDESGHSTESEALIPIVGIITSQQESSKLLGQVVLAGDPKQLGPIIHSKLAKSFGFHTSMLERLMNTCHVYQKNDNKYNANMVTKLLKNFRSHNAILKLPDEMFYDKELIAAGNDSTNLAIDSDKLSLPNAKFPLVFHNVHGIDDREGRSPSYFNRQEIDVVIKYLNNLVGVRLKGRIIEQTDIGIVSPYRKQVMKLQEACKKKNWTNILIGSVEQFQGQERLIIIISTVRSRQEYVEHDYKFHLGFLKNPKRFNVAITRAKSLVIVIGNSSILMWDKCWGQFIEYCHNNNALAGSKFEFQKLWLQNNDTFNNNEIQTSTLDNEIVQNLGSNEHADFSRGNI